jgi:uncharacterized protein with GYD domain
MAHFMLQIAYTADAWAKMAKNPEDREVAARGLVERAGGRLQSMHFTLGAHDVVAIYEAPDAKAAAAIAVAASVAGHLRSCQTTELLTAAEAVEVMKKAGGLAYQGPKG